MRTIDPLKTSIPQVHRTLLGAVGPRPIAFASTVDREGNPNLSPFSFYNVFGANPATLVFSPSRRGKDNTTKDTFENVRAVPEVVINAVNFAIVEQMNLASSEYPRGTNEFIKSGLTPLPSERVRPFRVKESPVQFECRVRDIIETGQEGGAGNLVICDVLLIHLDEDVLDAQGLVDPAKIDLVGRLGGDYYCRASGDALFVVEKPLARPGIGIDALPDAIRHSRYLSGNDLGKLGNTAALPGSEEVEKYKEEMGLDQKLENAGDREKMVTALARELLEKNRAEDALKVLLGYL